MKARHAVAVAVVAALPALAQLDDARSVFAGGVFGAPVESALGIGSGGREEPAPLFDFHPTTSGPSQIGDTLTVNGYALDLVVSCDARNGNDTSLACTGATLTASGTGAMELRSAPFTEAGARTVYSTGTRAYSGSWAGIGTSDFVVEWVQFHPVSTTIGTYATSGGGFCSAVVTGWGIGTGGTPEFRMCDGTATVTITAGLRGSTGHGIVFVDRNENSTDGARMWFNGTNTVGYNASGVTGSLVGGGDLRIAPATMPFTSFRIWKCPASTPACFAGGATNTTQWGAVAVDRWLRLSGALPAVAVGASSPTSTQRATVAYTDFDRDGDGVRRVVSVGPYFHRIATRPDLSSTLHTGYLSEPAGTNIGLQSQTFDNATWTKQTAGDTTSTTSVAPDESATADGLIADASAAFHGRYQSITYSATAYTCSVWAKAGAVEWAGIYHQHATTPNGVMFHLTGAGSVGARYATNASDIAGTIESWGGGWYRIAVTFTATAAAANTYVIPSDENWNADGGGQHSFTGDGATASATLWGFQCETGPLATSYIPTTTATASRVTDTLRFAATGNTATHGSYIARVLLPPLSSTTVKSVLAVGVDGNNETLLYLGTGPALSQGRTGGGTEWSITGSSGDVTDGNAHEIGLVTLTNDVRVYFDDALVGTDVVATPQTVDASDTIAIGDRQAAAGQTLNGLVLRVRAYDGAVTPLEVNP